MILAAFLAAIGTTAGPAPPNDVDRFISICVDGGKNLLDQSGTLLSEKDVPKVLLSWFGKPADYGTFAEQYFSVGQGDQKVVVSFMSFRHGVVVQSECTVASAKFDPVTGRQALLQKLSGRGIEDVTTERFIVGNVNVNGHERAYQNPIVQYKLSTHLPIDEATLQTADPNFEIFVRAVAGGKLNAMSVFNLSAKDARDAKRAWDKCRKADCSLP